MRRLSTAVRRVNQGGGRVYRVSASASSSEAVMPSVTSVLNVLEKAALLPWAIRICIEEVRRGLYGRTGDTPLSTEWLDKLLARAASAPDAIKHSSAAFGTRTHAVCSVFNNPSTCKYAPFPYFPLPPHHLRPSMQLLLD